MAIPLETLTVTPDDEIVGKLVEEGVMSQCGECTACCTHLSIDYMSEFKPEHIDCKHLLIDGGCSIYENRPGGCKQFSCVWKSKPPEDVLSKEQYEALRPDRSGVIIYLRAGFLGDMKRANVIAAETRPNAMNEKLNQWFALQVAGSIESIVAVVPFDRKAQHLAANIMIPGLPYAEALEREIQDYYKMVTGKSALTFGNNKIGDNVHRTQKVGE